MGKVGKFQMIADKISERVHELTGDEEMLLVKHLNGRYYLIGKKDGKVVLCCNNGYHHTEFEALLKNMLSILGKGTD